MNGLWPLLLMLLASPALGQETPVLKTEFEQTEAIPGTPLSLRLTVLVPTYLPSPPEWPGFEAPNVMVRLPERSTGPTSARVGGETWAGVTRHYRLYPMVPGEFEIPPQTVQVTYADTESGDRRQIDLTTDPLRFRGVVPPGAESLDPFFAAGALTLEQSHDGGEGPMKPGDSLTWSVTAKVSGTSPMFLPKLLPELSFSGVAIYPDEPVVSETSARGVMAGTRTESVTLLAQVGGQFEVPAISLDWYNIASSQVETASVEGFAFEIDAPLAPPLKGVDWRWFLGIAVLALIGILFVFWGVRRWGGGVRQRWHVVRQRRLTSEAHAYRQLKQTIARRDFARLYPALDIWSAKQAGHDPRHDPNIRSALISLGQARYGGKDTANTGTLWKSLDRSVARARSAAGRKTKAKHALPPLNPGPQRGTAG
ncbi:hypothetical protein RE428_23720 [Marinobacter nanhaiticus D15-8W]|uniref:Protein BatD n=1 Tax=Marinobacter nanhaiticus D15-8W TaxID=626887 RepID=N6WQW3_9GAMM|nr:BatD family protein [Marinobacter nanhaiticus]ENO13976.1 hypothetical protein J057_21310 [Marinobacter nanhaiticus D15-8W]BES71354.1 hypothetical protein RE428_23720 [Marinobacter nanhaiticus D15-8W]